MSYEESYEEWQEPCPCGQGTVTIGDYEAYSSYASHRDWRAPVRVDCPNGCHLVTRSGAYDHKTGYTDKPTTTVEIAKESTENA